MNTVEYACITHLCPAPWASSWCPRQQLPLWISAASLLLEWWGCTLTYWPLTQRHTVLPRSVYVILQFAVRKKKKKEKVVYFNQCNNSVLPQQSFWRWAAWSPGSGGAVVWQWRAHSQRTGIRRRWQSGRFLFSDSRITPKQCKESQS